MVSFIFLIILLVGFKYFNMSLFLIKGRGCGIYFLKIMMCEFEVLFWRLKREVSLDFVIGLELR